MDRAFLSYYEAELAHIRELSGEFAALHPTVARNLSLDAVPCPDPYVERLLEGVAYLAARTRLKLDGESQRHVRGILDALYPDLAGPAPAMSTVVLHPGPQVQTMADGHLVKRGTRLVAALREGVSTRAIYTTAQDVTLWPIALASVEYLQDRGALSAAGVPDAQLQGAEAGLRLTFKRQGAGSLADLSLDRLDLEFSGGPRAGAIFDAIFAAPLPVIARKADGVARFATSAAPDLIGIRDDEALLPRLRSSFEGYRLMREYFLMPERFYGLRLTGLAPAIRSCGAKPLEVIVPMGRAAPVISQVVSQGFPAVRHARSSTCLKKNATSSRWTPAPPRMWFIPTAPDRWISRCIACCASRMPRPTARNRNLPRFIRPPRWPDQGWSTPPNAAPAAPARTNCAGARPAPAIPAMTCSSLSRGPAGVDQTRPLRRLDVRALVSNRDLPIFDDTPKLTLDTGDPVARVELLSAMRRPRGSLVAGLPQVGRDGEAQLDDLTWRLVGQLSLNHLSLAEDPKGAEPLRAMLDLYADRGDPALARHVRSLVAGQFPPRDRAAGSARPPLPWPGSRDHPAYRRRAAVGRQRAAVVGPAGAAVRAPCQHQFLCPHQDAAATETGGGDMADGPGQPRPDLGFRSPDPEEIGFFELLRRLERDGLRFGRSGGAGSEPARLGQRARLAMATRDVAGFTPPGDTTPAQVEVEVLGLFGPEGAMPLHMTRWIMARQSERWFTAADSGGQGRVTADTTFLDFCNMLQHRQLALFWRAWADLHPEVGVEHAGGDRVTAMLETLAGLGSPVCERPIAGQPTPIWPCGRRHRWAIRSTGQSG